MTVSSSVSKIVGDGNGSTTVWPFSFKTYDAAHLKIIYTDADGVESVLLTGYSVGLNANQETNPGGTVTYSPAIASGTKLTILRVVPYTQTTDIKNQGGYYPEVLERRLDLAVMQVQQLAEQSARSVKVDVSSSTNPDDLLDEIQQDIIDANAAAVAAAGSEADAEAAQAAAEVAQSAAEAAQAAAEAAAASVPAFGTIATQDASDVGITGGTVEGLSEFGGGGDFLWKGTTDTDALTLFPTRQRFATESTDAGTWNGLVSAVVQKATHPGHDSFPCGITAYGKLASGAAGNAVFGLFARVDLGAAGMATNEMNSFNFAGDPPGTFPPDLTFGTSDAYAITLVLGAGGTHNSHTALMIGPEGGQPQKYICGIYMKPDGITNYGIIVDATSTEGPAVSATFQNTGQGSNVHINTQTKGTQVDANPVIQHYNGGGGITWKITQDGSFYIGGTKVLYAPGFTAYTPALTAASGTITTTTGATGQYYRLGNMCFVSARVTITTNGTGSGACIMTLPFNAASDQNGILQGRESGLYNKGLHGSISNGSSGAFIFAADGTYPGANGAIINISGWYRVA